MESSAGGSEARYNMHNPLVALCLGLLMIPWLTQMTVMLIVASQNGDIPYVFAVDNMTKISMTTKSQSKLSWKQNVGVTERPAVQQGVLGMRFEHIMRSCSSAKKGAKMSLPMLGFWGLKANGTEDADTTWARAIHGKD